MRTRKRVGGASEDSGEEGNAENGEHLHAVARRKRWE